MQDVQIKVHIVEKLNNQSVENQNPDKSTFLQSYYLGGYIGSIN